MFRLVVAFCLIASPLRAADSLSADEFEARVTGLTLFFHSRGKPYGAEQYLPGRQVIWTYLDGKCEPGFWYAERDMICFIYEHEPGPQCWTFLRTEQGLSARGERAAPGDDLSVAGESHTPLSCAVPGAGV